MSSKIKSILFYAGILALTLIPILNIIRMINYGDNNLSNDYILIVPAIIKALDGQLDIKEFINASWLRSHFIPVPMLVYIINAYFLHWNIFFDMYFCVLLMFFRLILVWDMFTRWQKGPSRLLALPFLSSLIFSATQASTYTWGGVATTFGLLLFLGTLGIWSLIYFDGRPLGFWIMVLCGILCSWTWGAGVLIWPLYLVVIIFLRYYKVQNILLWFAGTVFAAIPYVYFMLKIEFQDSSIDSSLNLLNLKTIILLLGASLTEVKFQYETPLFYTVGIFGVFSFVGLIFTWLRMHDYALLKYFLPSLIIVLWGILGAWQISMGRTDLAPWYTSVSINFWVGIFGFAYLLMFQNIDNLKLLQPLKYIEMSLPVIVMLTMFVFYLKYNVFTPSEPFYLPSRAPSSAACLRNYRSAPTYCEGLLYQWGVGHIEKIEEMAAPLERHQLSSFSPNQVWTLQGDYVFKDVIIHNPLYLDVSWWAGLNGKRAKWNDYRHLDLMLPSSTAIDWPVDLTDSIDSAVLKTAAGIHTFYLDSKNEAPVIFVIKVITERGDEKEVYRESNSVNARGWKKLQIDLKEFLGQKIIIRLSTLGAEEGMGIGAMFQYPIIYVHQSHPPREKNYQPENVEPLVDLENGDNIVFIHDGSDADKWKAVNMTQDADKNNIWLLSSDAMFQLEMPVNLCLANYSNILFDIAQTENVERRYISVQFWTSTGYQVFEIPLMRDGQRHVYSYPLRLLDLDPYSFLQDIRILPNGTEGGEIQFGGVELIASGNSTNTCANYYPPKLISPDTIVGEIIVESHVGQTFVSECQGAIDSIGVLTATFARNNTQPLIFTLMDAGAGNVIWRQSIPGEKVENNDWVTFSSNPIVNSYQKEYYISLESPTSTLGDAVTIYQSQSNQYNLGQLYINDTPSDLGDLVFKYHCSKK